MTLHDLFLILVPGFAVLTLILHGIYIFTPDKSPRMQPLRLVLALGNLWLAVGNTTGWLLGYTSSGMVLAAAVAQVLLFAVFGCMWWFGRTPDKKPPAPKHTPRSLRRPVFGRPK